MIFKNSHLHSLTEVENCSIYLRNHLKLDEGQIENLTNYFESKFPDEDIINAILKLQDIKPFAAGGNIWESGQEIDEPTLLCMRWIAGLKMEEVLDVLKFDLQDSNLVQELDVGNIGTAQRWAKTVTGSNLEADDEMMCGRYAKPPRLATFPNVHENQVPITKICRINSVCSHHFLPYSSEFNEDAYLLISYIPNEFVLGISKLQRVVEHISRRPTIQEDLTKSIFQAISEAAQTEDVYVKLCGLKHTCEWLRGAQSNDSSFTTEYFGGKFNDIDLRSSIKTEKN